MPTQAIGLFARNEMLGASRGHGTQIASPFIETHRLVARATMGPSSRNRSRLQPRLVRGRMNLAELLIDEARSSASLFSNNSCVTCWLFSAFTCASALKLKLWARLLRTVLPRGLLLLLAEHDPRLGPVGPAAEAGVVLDRAALGVVERDAVVVVHADDVLLDREIDQRPVEAADALERIGERQAIASRGR